MSRRLSGPTVSFFAFQDIITAVVGIFILITLILILELTQRLETAGDPPSADVDQIQSAISSLEAEAARLSEAYQLRIEHQNQTADLSSFSREAKFDELRASLMSAEERLNSVTENLKQTSDRLAEANKNQTRLLLESKDLTDSRSRISELQERIDAASKLQDRLNSDDGLIYRDQTPKGRSLCLVTMDRTGIVMKDAKSKRVRDFTSANPVDEFAKWLGGSDLQSRHFLLLVKPGGDENFQAVRDLMTQSRCVFGFDVVGKADDAQLGFEWEQGK